MKITLIEENNIQADEIKQLTDGIAEHTRLMRGFKPLAFFAFFIKDQLNQIQGGCNGNTLYGGLQIDQLWVTAKLRGQGYGTKLMSAAENWGKNQSCTFATVNTMDWEALGFYQKLGYQIEFERHGFEKNSIFYFLRKPL